MNDYQPGFDLRLVEPFVVLADEELHFPAAATRLGIGPSALSRQIARLQRELRTTLIGMNGRSHALTPAGQRFLVHARAIQARLQAFDRDGPVVRTDAVRVHLLMGPLSFAEDLITEYATAHPEVEVDVCEDLDVQPAEALRTGKVDVAVDLREACPPGAAFRSIRRVSLGVLTSPAHPLAALERATWTDLQGESLLVPEMAGAASWATVLGNALSEAGVVVRERPSPAVARLRFVAPVIARGDAVLLGPHPHDDGGAQLTWRQLEPERSADVGVSWYPDRASSRVRQFVEFVLERAGGA